MISIKRILLLLLSLSCFLFPFSSSAQLKWIKVDSLYQPLPSSVHVYKTTDSLDGKPNIAYYVEADLKDKHLDFTTDTTRDRRITPQSFYERNNHALVVVNCTFFSYLSNRSLNTVIRDGKLLAYNTPVLGRGRDTLLYWHPLSSAIGISQKREADVAWLYTDSTKRFPYAIQNSVPPVKDSFEFLPLKKIFDTGPIRFSDDFDNLFLGKTVKEWKMQTAVGGGPVLMQGDTIKISNNNELKFAGKAINDTHPRTAMGYTKDNRLIILVIQGRFPGNADGATLPQEAQILKDIGCREALNLDGGGSSCLLVNGKETIKPSDKAGQRPVPAVFLIKAND